LPTLNYTPQELRDIIYQSESSLVKKWLKPPYNIDGWRFDVADIMGRNDEIQLHHEIWPQIRQSIKAVNQEAYLLAEDWSDCSEYLQGTEWDATMNYFGFARPVREFFGETDLFNRRTPALNHKPYKPNARHLRARLMGHLSRLPYVIWQNQFNLLDSHDVPRLHNNPLMHPLEYKGAVIMMFSMPGTPNVYYGDEATCAGRLDDNEGFRYPMPWGSGFETTDQFRFYQTLSHLKTTKKALSDGGFKIISDDHDVFSYARFTLDEVIISVHSADPIERTIAIPLSVFGKQAFTLTKDLLGTPLQYEIKNKEILLKVMSHTSYLFELL
jgi:alpha-glucosidase